VDSLLPDLLAVSRFLHANPEIAYEERQAAELLTSILEQHGFEVTRGIADLPTAFTGRAGSRGPQVAFLAEYDALPGIGHACGHNLIGAASLGAALALKPLLDQIPLRVLLVGCPAEEKGGGKIVNISSTTGFGGTYPEIQNAVAYNTSKGAVITLTKDLGVKWARYNIHVNGIAPGPFVTHMTEKHFAGVGEDQMKNANPLGRFGSEWDLKGAVVFLSSAASDFITGLTIPVDGGSNALC
jgi:NAD(P)-dependent dehydrogenase (short-subunit alcohol dehydrogenase family)